MSAFPPRAALDARWPPAHRLGAMLEARAPRPAPAVDDDDDDDDDARSRGERASGDVAPTRATRAPAFRASLFGFEDVSAFVDASEAEREQVVRLASQAVLREACGIERSGMAYAAKMALLAETVDERALYCHFAADEATHFARVAAHLDAPPRPGDPLDPFQALLVDAIDEGPRAALLFLVQVVLEGWGLAHYRRLLDGCASPGLARELRAILRDEARHHGSGLVLFDEAELDPRAEAFVEERLAALLALVAAGPIASLDALERGLGHLGRAGRARAFAELRGAAEARARLARLRALAACPALAAVVARLDARGAFTPHASEPT